jgi:hypothetical protein
MHTADALPNALAECHHLLLAAFKETTQLERRVVAAEQSVAAATQRATQSEQQVAELGRVGRNGGLVRATAAGTRRDAGGTSVVQAVGLRP